MAVLSSIRRAIKPTGHHGEMDATHLINWDVKPLEPARKVWGFPAFLGMWCVTAFSMTTFQTGSGMLALGLNWWQVIVGTLIGSMFAAILVTAASWPGLEYGIPFPVVTRAFWGHYGAIFVIVLRITLSIIWSGIQSYQGGQMTYVCLRAMAPSIDSIPNTIDPGTGMISAQLVGVVVFFILQLPVLLLKPVKLKWMVIVAGTLGFVTQLGLTIWSTSTIGSEGFGTLFSSTSSPSSSQLAWAFVMCFSLTMSNLTSGTLSICDYSRFSKSVKKGASAQLLMWLPVWMSCCFGLLTIAATQSRFNSQLWSLLELLVAIQDYYSSAGARAAVFFCALCLVIGQMGFNITGNTFSGGTDMASLLPKYLTIRRGQFITAFLGIVINPWYLVASGETFFAAMSSFTIFLQPMLGIMAAHYFIIFGQKMKLEDLYNTNHSIYFYNRGVNWRAVVSWLCGCVPHLPGFFTSVDVVEGVSEGAVYLYHMQAFTSFFFAFVVSILLNIAFPVLEQKQYLRFVTKAQAMDLKDRYIESLEQIEGVEPGVEERMKTPNFKE